MKPHFTGVIVLAGMLVAVASADEKPLDLLDCGANVKLFATHFGRHGMTSEKVVVREKQGVRLRVNGAIKGAKPSGLYSYFALAGDFEVRANYDVIDVPPPTDGYGAGFGFAFETKGPPGDVTVRRGQWKGEGSGVQIVRGQADASGDMKYDAKFSPTNAKKGQIVFRREKAEAVVLTADNLIDEPTEVFRIPFTDATVRTMLIFADPGGSPTVVEGRLTGLKVTAGEITGGIPERDIDETPGWVVALAVGIALLVGWKLVGWLRRRRS